ncbi:MAG TPA: hypothetical protein VFM99_07675 [Chitinophagales bacterium]|nr:hypothetical protein [Chitinophagales bacterium]
MKEIRIIESRENEYYRVTINGKDAYTPFKFQNFEEREAMRIKAKACALDEIIRCHFYDEKYTIHYDSY